MCRQIYKKTNSIKTKNNRNKNHNIIFRILKNQIFLGIIVCITILLTGCRSVGDVITQKPREYIYKANEEILFYDNIKTGDLLSSLTFVSMFTLSEDPFTIQETVRDENGDIVYKDVVYEQLIQINYRFISNDNYSDNIVQLFRIIDAGGESGKNDPSIEYSEIPVSGMDSFVVALENKSDKIKIQVYYSGVFTPNAVAELTKEDSENTFPELTEPDATVNNDLYKSIIQKYEKVIDRQKNLMLIFVFLTIAELLVILFLLFKRKK